MGNIYMYRTYHWSYHKGGVVGSHMIDLLYLLEFYNTYDQNDIYHEIAKKLLANFFVISEMSITELSEYLFVSTSTIYRFIKMMGYDNFNQMKAGHISFIENYYLQGRYVPKYQETNTISSFTKYLVNRLEKLKAICTDDKINHIADQILAADEVIFVGMPMPSFIWRLQTELIMLGKKTSAFLNPYYQQEAIKHASKNTYVIFVQYLTEYSTFYLDVIKSAEDKKLKHIVITTLELLSYQKYVKDSIYIEGDLCENDLFILEVIFNYLGHRLNQFVIQQQNKR